MAIHQSIFSGITPAEVKDCREARSCGTLEALKLLQATAVLTALDHMVTEGAIDPRLHEVLGYLTLQALRIERGFLPGTLETGA